MSQGKVDEDGDVVRLTLDQALGNGGVTTEWPGDKVQTNFTTSPDMEKEMDKSADQPIRRPAQLLLELVELTGIEPVTS